MKPPVCTVCHRPHWRNQQCLGSPSDWNLEYAQARGIEVADSVTVVTDVTHTEEGEGAQKHLLSFLKEHPNAEQKEIKQGVRARWQDVRRALTDQLKLGAVSKSGAGTRNSGYRYSVRDGRNG